MAVSFRRGRWYTDYRDSAGKRRQFSFRTKREAEEREAEVTLERRQAIIPVVDPEITVSAYSERWLALVLPTLKATTHAGYKQRLRTHILPVFGTVRVRQLQRGRLRALLSEKLAAGLAVDSVRLIHATVRAMLSAAVEDGVLLSNPAVRLGKTLHLAKSKAARQEEIRALDRAQSSLFLSTALAVAPRLYALFFTLARTGVRIGEALGLQWGDVDFEGREIRVERSLSTFGEVGTPKSGHGRTVDMGLALRDVLRCHRAKLQAAALEQGAELAHWVFPSDAATPLDHANVGKAFKRVLKHGKLPLHHSLHDLRHTFASLLLQQGESIQYVQRMLGHSSITLTVDTYGRWLPMGNKRAVDRLDETPSEPSGGRMVAEATTGRPAIEQVVDKNGAPRPIRTGDLQIRSATQG